MKDIVTAKERLDFKAAIKRYFYANFQEIDRKIIFLKDLISQSSAGSKTKAFYKAKLNRAYEEEANLREQYVKRRM